MKYSAYLNKKQGGRKMSTKIQRGGLTQFSNLEWGASFTDEDTFYFDPDLPEGKIFPKYLDRPRVYVRIALTNEAIYLPNGTSKPYSDDKLVCPTNY